MNSLQLLSIFFNSILSVGSSTLLLYSNLEVNKDLVELNIFLTSIFTVVNFYTVYSESRCDELGYSKEYKATNEDIIDDTPSITFNNLETNELISEHINSLYNYDDLYEENI